MTDVQQTRANFRMRLGEVIEVIIGSSKLRELFEAAEQGGISEQFQIATAGFSGEAPSGQLALRMGLIDRETKDALLTAQAAERTLQSIEELEKFYDKQLPALQTAVNEFVPPQKSLTPFEMFIESHLSQHEDLVEQYYADHVAKADLNNPSYKFIGSDGDPEVLVRAQAGQQLMAQYEHNEKQGQKEAIIRQFMRVPDYKPFGLKYIDAFKESVAVSYKEAGRILQEKGYSDVADNIHRVTDTIAFDPKNAKLNPIQNFVQEIVSAQHQLVNRVNAELDPYGMRGMPYTSVNEEWEQRLHKRAAQTMRPAA